jgi:hypothetical protein
MPSLEDNSVRNDDTQLTCDIHTSEVGDLARAYPEPSDWLNGSLDLTACRNSRLKLGSAATMVLDDCFDNIGEITELYSDKILNQSTLKPRVSVYAPVFKCKMEPPCRKPTSELEYEGQVWFEVPVSEQGNGTSETHTKTVAHRFLTDFQGPIAQSLENAKTGYTWDQSKDEVSYSDRYLTVLARRHANHPERELAFVSFRRNLADEEDENESE